MKLGQQHVKDGNCPWAIVSVWGFAGQPVNFTGAPPTVGAEDECKSDYSIIILPHEEYVLMVASGNGDTFQTV